MSFPYSKDLTRESRSIACFNLSIGRSVSDCEFKFDLEELEEIYVVINTFQFAARFISYTLNNVSVCYGIYP